jgi:hypothetical protein
MDSFDFETFFTTLQFSREQASKLATFLTRCLELGAAAGIGFGGVAYAESAQRGDARSAAITGLAGFLVAGGAAYVTCRMLRSRILDIVAQYAELSASAGSVAQQLTSEERQDVVDEAYKILRMDPGRATTNPELMA